MLVKDAQTSVRARLDFYPTLVLWEKPEWLAREPRGPLSASLQKKANWACHLALASFSTFQHHAPLKVSFCPCLYPFTPLFYL